MPIADGPNADHPSARVDADLVSITGAFEYLAIATKNRA